MRLLMHPLLGFENQNTKDVRYNAVTHAMLRVLQRVAGAQSSTGSCEPVVEMLRSSKVELFKGIARTTPTVVEYWLETTKDRIYKRCPLEIQGEVFPAYLIELPFNEFDLIFGMEWLVEHQVSLDCAMKRVRLKAVIEKEIVMVGERLNYLSNVISAMVVGKKARKGCEAFMAYVQDANAVGSSVDNICTIKEFLDIFPEELLGLPLEREVEFGIELLSGVAPVSIAPYRMATKELKELKVQLQELLNWGFIRTSVSPWGAPVLFVKKER
ncbi:uncharacterized protein LOC108466403 [Gossypium arboreum]|uniref:uncharacterized protein LOC108466403 n=1 Tax=Gossypium arboreum TaxID=29729 RepID=UPI0008190DCF|nr:uncharacterized protein LOC108466403 [Gossypium arboreum]